MWSVFSRSWAEGEESGEGFRRDEFSTDIPGGRGVA